MTRISVLALTLLATILFIGPHQAYADLKCGDAPYALGSEGLVVTWSGPVPQDARVAYGDGEIFNMLNESIGPEIPEAFPKEYTEDLHEVQLSNSYMAWATDELIRWQERYGIKMEQEPLSIFEEYLRQGYLIFGTLVEHPFVEDPPSFTACSVVLQRGVIIYDEGVETLFLRSYFHSATSSGSYVNFVPSDGIVVSFASDAIWFPLELSRVISEPSTYVVLDILTREPLEDISDNPSFTMATTGEVDYQGSTFSVTRVTAQLAAGEEAPDFRVKPHGAEDPEEMLHNLFRYEAPTFVWEKEVLGPEDIVSDAIAQAPIQLPDGSIEENKAIVVRRGDWVETEFVPNVEGEWFLITLLVSGETDAIVSGMLHPDGFGNAASCWRPDVSLVEPGQSASEMHSVRTFNCFFRTTLQEDGSVRVLWTMFHSPEEEHPE